MMGEEAVVIMTLGLAGLGIAAAGGAIVVGLRILRVAGAQAEEVGGLRRRIDALEAEVGVLASIGETTGRRGGAAESPVAAAVPNDGFPRLAAAIEPAVEALPALTVVPSLDDAASASREDYGSAWGAETATDSWPATDFLAEPAAAELRVAFATLVRAHNHRAALIAGEEIAELFPDSRMAADFHRLRPYLEAQVRRQTSSTVEAG